MKVKPFEVGSDFRRDYKRWLEHNFAYFNGNRSESKLSEVAKNKHLIFTGAETVLHMTMELSGPEIKRYYLEDFFRIQNTYTAACLEGKVEDFAHAIDTFKDGIDWE